MNKTIWGKNVSTKFLEGTALLHAVRGNDKFVVTDRIFKSIFLSHSQEICQFLTSCLGNSDFFYNAFMICLGILTVQSRWVFYATSNHITGFHTSKDWQPDYYLLISAQQRWHLSGETHTLPANYFRHFCYLDLQLLSSFYLSAQSFVPHALILTEWLFVLFFLAGESSVFFSLSGFETNEVG